MILAVQSPHSLWPVLHSCRPIQQKTSLAIPSTSFTSLQLLALSYIQSRYTHHASGWSPPCSPRISSRKLSSRVNSPLGRGKWFPEPTCLVFWQSLVSTGLWWTVSMGISMVSETPIRGTVAWHIPIDSAMHDAVPAIAAAGVSPIVRIPDMQGWMVKSKHYVECMIYSIYIYHRSPRQWCPWCKKPKPYGEAHINPYIRSSCL